MGFDTKKIGLAWKGILILSASVVFGQTKPNVVIFYADDLGWGDLRFNNKDPQYDRYTPQIDNLFTQGVVFNNYVTHAVCSPSRAGLLTGKHFAALAAGPQTEGELPTDVMTFGKDFQQNGYVTGCFGKWHNGKPPKPVQSQLVSSSKDIITDNAIFEYTTDTYFGIGVNGYGFDSAANYYGGGPDHFTRFTPQVAQNDWWVNKDYHGTDTGYTTHLVTDYAIRFIEANKQRPFAMYVPEECVHEPVQLVLDELQEFCGKLGSEVGLPGKWNAIKDYTSPISHNQIQNVQQIRCGAGEEFDVRRMPAALQQIIVGAYLYALDKSVGKIIQKVKDIGAFNNTIFLFASDNGAIPPPIGCNLPFKGSKHTLWEGGVHVPAAIWWPGTFDANSAPYAPGQNVFNGYIGYCDIYPTLMAMSGNTLHATKIDGQNAWDDIRKNTEPRPGLTKPYFEMWDDYGSIRTNTWKLMYSQSANRTELYNLTADVAEANNVAAANPQLTRTLLGMYTDWLTTNKYAMPYIPLAPSNISSDTVPRPSGEAIEVKAWQNGNSINGGVRVRFGIGSWVADKLGSYVEPGDRVQFDMYVCGDSKKTSYFTYTPARQGTPIFNDGNGIDQNGNMVQTMRRVPEKWYRHIVGIGSDCPRPGSENYISLSSPGEGYYHFYLDNVVVLKNDGTPRSVIWESGKDFAPLIYSYKNQTYSSFAEAKAVAGFPFDSISVKAFNTGITTGIPDRKSGTLAGGIKEYTDVTVFNPQGKVCMHLKMGGGDDLDMVLKSVTTGVYFLRYSGGTQKSRVIKVSKSKAANGFRIQELPYEL